MTYIKPPPRAKFNPTPEELKEENRLMHEYHMDCRDERIRQEKRLYDSEVKLDNANKKTEKGFTLFGLKLW